MSTPPLIPEDLAAAIERAKMPDFPRWHQMMNATGGCGQPIRLQGERFTVDGTTGELIESYTTADEPNGYLLTACGNRRASRCAACSEVYREDTYHLIISGLIGGKGVPEQVSAHPRAFLTLTAPSFGAVHTRRSDGTCRRRRDRQVCEHGRPQGCGIRHAPEDRMLGQPVCEDCYDYPAAVLWNAHAPELWRRFTLAVPKALTAELGITHRRLREQARLSYARVIEYQRRGLIHFHAVLRIDGPTGPDTPPPPWADTALLERALRAAIDTVSVDIPHPDADGRPMAFRWGAQHDIRPIQVAAELDGIADKHVARYIAKYATKGAEDSGTIDRPIHHAHHITGLNVSEHARRMIWTCFSLADLPAYREVPLRQWAHMLGYRGHFSTKSRRYSLTLTELRQARATHARRAAGHPEPVPGTVTVQDWRYSGSGLLYGEHFWAERTRNRIQAARNAATQRAGRDDDPV
ncbi:plasmid replication initiator protein [Actinocorallia aurea]